MNKARKVLGMVMAALMCLALTPAAAFAAVPGDGESVLTIEKGLENHTYKVYQLLVGDVSASVENGDLDTVSNAKPGKNLMNGDIAKLLDEMAKYPNGGYDTAEAANGLVVGDPFRTLPNNDEWTYNDNQWATVVPNGYYLIRDEINDGHANDDNAVTSLFMARVVGSTTVTTKSDVPTLTKKITNDNVLADGVANTAAIGDTVAYELNATLGEMTGYRGYTIVFQDEMSSGLTLDQTSIEVKFRNTAVTLPQDAIVSTANSFKVTLEDIFSLGFDPEPKAGEVFTVTYKATVNESAAVGKDPNTNEAWLSYSNNPNMQTIGDLGPFGDTPKKTTETYVTELQITKYDGNIDDNKRLSGVQFTLTGDNLKQVIVTFTDEYVESETGIYYKLADGTYTQVAPTAETADRYDSIEIKYDLTTRVATASKESEDESVSVKATVDEQGYLKFTGLNIGEYTLSETETPEGYNTIEDIKFTIGATYANGISFSSSNDKITTNGGTLSVEIENYKGAQLPSTGGMGTTILYVVGAILVIGAVVLLVRRRSSAK